MENKKTFMGEISAKKLLTQLLALPDRGELKKIEEREFMEVTLKNIENSNYKLCKKFLLTSYNATKSPHTFTFYEWGTKAVYEAVSVKLAESYVLVFKIEIKF